MISEEMRRYEERTADEIRSMRKGQQMWKMIKKVERRES